MNAKTKDLKMEQSARSADTSDSKNEYLAMFLEIAMENLRKARRHVADEEGKQLLYHAGMTIRTLQQRYDLSERNLG